MPADSREGNERFFPPESVSRVLAEFIVRFNNDEESGFMDRRELMTRAAPLVGTGGDRRDEARGWLAVDWLVRLHAPVWLERAQVSDAAAALRGLAPVRDSRSLQAAGAVLETVVKPQIHATWEAAGDALEEMEDVDWMVRPGDAAGDAALGAAMTANMAARGSAADWAWGLAGDAANIATTAAAGGATDAGAADAVWAALWPTRSALGRSAMELLDRMIEASDPRQWGLA